MSVHPEKSNNSFAFVALSVAFAVNMMGSTIPTAVYHFYQITYGFSSPTITVIYACYAGGVLATLLFVGNWSDQLGRKFMLTCGLIASAAASLTFLLSLGLHGLLLGRAISGISGGIFTGTATVAIVEAAGPARRHAATLAATASNMLGLGLGPIVGGIVVELLPDPLRAPYIVHLLFVCVALVLVFNVPETVPKPLKINLRVRRISLPTQVRAAFIPAAISGFAGFCVIGFFVAVISQLMREVLGFHDSVLIGATILLLFIFSGLGQAIQTRIPKRWQHSIGSANLVLGLILIAVCAREASTVALFLGTALSGFGQGVSFRAGLADIAEMCPMARQGEVMSVFFVVLYAAISLPIIGVGVAIHMFGIQAATLLFSAFTLSLVLVASALLRYNERNERLAARAIDAAKSNS